MDNSVKYSMPQVHMFCFVIINTCVLWQFDTKERLNVECGKLGTHSQMVCPNVCMGCL